jgi:hypothetical protein
MLGGLLGLKTGAALTPSPGREKDGPRSAVSTSSFSVYDSALGTPWTSSSTASIHGMKSRRTTGDTQGSAGSGSGSSRVGRGADAMLKADGGGEGEGRGAPRSWDSPFTQAPGVKHPYRPEEALEDIPGLQHALQLFLESRMMESEEYCRRMDERQ